MNASKKLELMNTIINACCSRMTAHCPTESCKDYEHYEVLYNE